MFSCIITFTEWQMYIMHGHVVKNEPDQRKKHQARVYDQKVYVRSGIPLLTK
jgi:hypothetical protein